MGGRENTDSFLMLFKQTLSGEHFKYVLNSTINIFMHAARQNVFSKTKQSLSFEYVVYKVK